MKVAGVVLCGGQSSRMGENKSELVVGGQTLLERGQELLKSCQLDAVFVSGPEGIKDLEAGLGPLAGIYSSLTALGDWDALLFIPVDMPLMSVPVVNELLNNVDTAADLVHFKSHYFPLWVHNNHRVKSCIREALGKQRRSIKNLLASLTCEVVQHNHSDQVFFNANTPEQWQSVQHLLH